MSGDKIPSAEKEARDYLLVARDWIEEKADDVLSKVPIHPNVISAARLPMGIAAGALHAISPIAGTAAYGATCACDWLDGAVARRQPEKMTEEGGRLDAHIDKWVNGSMMGYLLATTPQDPALITAAIVSVAIDYISQRQRGPIMGQIREAIRAVLHPETCEPASRTDAVSSTRANVWGKISFALQSASIGTWMAMRENETAHYAVIAGLVIASVVKIIGILKRRSNKINQTR